MNFAFSFSYTFLINFLSQDREGGKKNNQCGMFYSTLSNLNMNASQGDTLGLTSTFSFKHMTASN